MDIYERKEGLAMRKNCKEVVVLDLKGSECWMSDTYCSPMSCDGKDYNSVYQFMVHRKALAVRDTRTANRVINASTISEVSHYENSLKGKCYVNELWDSVKDELHSIGVIQKFRGNQYLRDKLMGVDLSENIKVIGGSVDIPLLRSVKNIIELDYLS